MAITLPRASAASVGTGGQRIGRPLPDAGDVPQERVAGDPGLDVNADQFGAGVGRAVEGFGAAAGEAGDRIQGRQEGIARDRDDTAFSETLSSSFRDLQKDADFADDRIIAQAMADAEAEEQRLLNAHPGGSRSRALLEVQLARRRVAFGDNLAVQNIIASRSQRDASVNRRVAGIVADSLSDPSVPIEQRFGQLEDAIKFLDLSPSEARTARAGGEEKIASALINRVISRGNIDENGLLIDARSMLENKELRDVLSPAVRGGLVDRIGTIESIVRKAGLNVQAEIVALEAVADRLQLSGEDRRDFIVSTLTEGNISDKQGALNRLVGKGIVDQDTSDKIAAGVFRVVPLHNEFGEVEGAIIVDLTDPGAANVQVPGQAEPTVPAPPSPDEPSIEAPPQEPQEPRAEAAPEQPTTEAAETLPQDRTLFDIATGDVAVTGIGPAVLEGLQKALGQVGVNIASAEQLVLRKNFTNAQRRLAVALVPNQRFPQKQVEFIIKSADIDLGAFKDRRSLVSSLVSLSSSLRGEEERAARDGNDESLPSKVRIAQTGVARAIGNFRESLGVPEGITPETIEAIGEPGKGGLETVFEFFKEAVGEAKQSTPAKVPSASDIGKLSEEEARALVETLPPDTRITTEQAKALKKKLGVK